MVLVFPGLSRGSLLEPNHYHNIEVAPSLHSLVQITSGVKYVQDTELVLEGVQRHKKWFKPSSGLQFSEEAKTSYKGPLARQACTGFLFHVWKWAR